MNERQHEQDHPPIDESTYGGSAAETGGLYDDAGPTTANPEGDTMSEEEEGGARHAAARGAQHVTDRPTDEAEDVLDEPGPGSDPGAAYRRAVDEEGVEPGDDEERGPDAGEVYRSGS